VNASAAPLLVSAPLEKFFGYYPGVVSVITAAHDGVANVMAAGWHSALSAAPPLYGVAIAPERHTYDLIRASGVFAVHFLPFEQAEAIAGAGSVSGRDGVDKFSLLDLRSLPGSMSDVPVLQDAYLAYECRVQECVPVGDHDWFVGEVLAVHHQPAAFDEQLVQRGDAVPGAVYYGRARYEALGAGEKAQFPPAAFRALAERQS
jgi:flavin reductase (DIM6/NTAB) family NADH-FMN oxidoreductase RutF